MKKIAIIGAGNLGISITEGLIKNKAFDPNQIIATRNNLNQIEHLKKLGVTKNAFILHLIKQEMEREFYKSKIEIKNANE